MQNKSVLHQHLEEKPYNMCLNCAHIGRRCDGPNFLAMEMPRLCEWCRLRKDYLHSLDSKKWTNAYIAEQAGLSKISVDRFLSGHVEDLKRSTISNVIKVLVNGTWGQYPCAMAALETEQIDTQELERKAEKATAECERLQAALETTKVEEKKKLDYLLKKMEFNEQQISQKDKLLEERADYLRRKDKWIALLSILLAICLLIIIVTLIADRLNPDKGWFWLADMFTSENTPIYGLNILLKK